MTDTLVERLEALDPNRYVEGIGSQKWIDACYNMAPHAYKLRDHIKVQDSRIAELRDLLGDAKFWVADKVLLGQIRKALGDKTLSNGSL